MTSKDTSGTQGRPEAAVSSGGRHASDAREVETALSPRGQALARLLPERLADLDPAVSEAFDEVVCRVPAARVGEAARRLKDDPKLSFKYLRLVTVVDYVEDEGELEVVYHLYSLDHHYKMVLKTRIPESDARVPSVTPVWRGASWYEREMHDLFGVAFEGHPGLDRLILPEDFEGYPGRKSYPLHDYDEW